MQIILPNSPLIVTDEQFACFAAANPGRRLERSATGELSARFPRDARTQAILNEISAALGSWTEENGGVAFGPPRLNPDPLNALPPCPGITTMPTVLLNCPSPIWPALHKFLSNHLRCNWSLDIHGHQIELYYARPAAILELVASSDREKVPGLILKMNQLRKLSSNE